MVRTQSNPSKSNSGSLGKFALCQYKLPALLALIYCILFNSVIITAKYHLYQASLIKIILELSKDFIITYSFVFILFVGLSINRYLFFFTTVFLFITGSIASYALYGYDLQSSKEAVRLLFENEFSETIELYNTKAVLWLIFSIFISVYTLLYYSYNGSTTYLNKIFAVGCLLFAIFNIAQPQYRILTNYFPYKYLHNTYIYLENTLKKKL